MQRPVTIIEIIIICLLGLWLLGSIGYAIFNRRMAAFTYYRDLFRWLSAYQLFSATHHDYRLSYRDRLPDNGIASWKIIPLAPAWKFFHIIWFPQKQVPQTVHSLIDDLAGWIAKKQEGVAMEKISERFLYKVIRNYVNRIPAGPGNAGRQFKIERITGGQEQNVFISDFYQP